MNPIQLEWRNRLIRWLPFLPRISGIRHLLAAASRWRNHGWETPPPYFVKRAALLAEARAIRAEILVETGTFLGDTTWAMRRHFHHIHTIEVAPVLAELARKRFRGDAMVTVIEGDSQDILPKLCAEIDRPCLFYLDGHYSGGITGMGGCECPVLAEIDAILTRTRTPFRIVIDDARLFGTDPAYPDIGELRKRIHSHCPALELRVENDAIVVG